MSLVGPNEQTEKKRVALVGGFGLNLHTFYHTYTHTCRDTPGRVLDEGGGGKLLTQNLISTPDVVSGSLSLYCRCWSFYGFGQNRYVVVAVFFSFKTLICCFCSIF